MTSFYKHRLWLFVLIVILLSACAASGTNTTLQPTTSVETQSPSGAMMTETPGAMMNSTPASGTPMVNTEIDQQFIDMMVPHHQGAVEMARIAQERSQRPEVQEMANNIVSSQEEEITKMKGWRQQWYGSSETPPMSAMPMMQEMSGMGEAGHPMDMQADVDALKNASEPFDLAFIDAMIPHHQSAIDAANMVKESAVHPEIRALAQQVIEEQQKEIDQMLNWRKTWFPDAPPLPTAAP